MFSNHFKFNSMKWVSSIYAFYVDFCRWENSTSKQLIGKNITLDLGLSFSFIKADNTRYSPVIFVQSTIFLLINLYNIYI